MKNITMMFLIFICSQNFLLAKPSEDELKNWICQEYRELIVKEGAVWDSKEKFTSKNISNLKICSCREIPVEWKLKATGTPVRIGSVLFSCSVVFDSGIKRRYFGICYYDCTDSYWNGDTNKQSTSIKMEMINELEEKR